MDTTQELKLCDRIKQLIIHLTSKVVLIFWLVIINSLLLQN